MTPSEVEQLVLASVRRHTANDKVGLRARFGEDLHLSETSRQMLFATVVEAFNARGVSLPSRGFFLRNFLACPTPADVQAAISDTVFGGKKAAKASASPAPLGESKSAKGGANTPQTSGKSTKKAARRASKSSRRGGSRR